MNYKILKSLINEIELFENQTMTEDNNFESFIEYLKIKYKTENKPKKINWENKEKGRSMDSIINTMIVHMSKYAKNYSRSIIRNTNFSSQEEYIFLINLDVFGKMTKMELIQKNIQDKPSGMLTINRLIDKGWVTQSDAAKDKRSKIINITELGRLELEKIMPKIKKASKVVTANLTENEKLQLIKLLQKLDVFHKEIYFSTNEKDNLIEIALEKLQYN